MFREVGTGLWRQPRPDWWRVSRFVFQLGKTVQSNDKEIYDNDLVHIGGIAVFLRGLIAFGAQAVANFRGTEDIDIVSFRPGALEEALTVMKSNGDITGWSKTDSRQFKDKSTVTVKLPVGNDPGGLKTLPIDLYQSRTAPSTEVHFNNRTLRPSRIVSDPPQSYSPLNGAVGRFVTPSTRDLFKLKLEAVDTTSAKKLRQKDKMDALWLASYAYLREGEGAFHDMIMRVLMDSLQFRGRESARLKLEQLEELYAKAKAETKVPTTQQIASKALDEVRRVKKGWRSGWKQDRQAVM